MTPATQLLGYAVAYAFLAWGFVLAAKRAGARGTISVNATARRNRGGARPQACCRRSPVDPVESEAFAGGTPCTHPAPDRWENNQVIGLRPIGAAKMSPEWVRGPHRFNLPAGWPYPQGWAPTLSSGDLCTPQASTQARQGVAREGQQGWRSTYLAARGSGTLGFTVRVAKPGAPFCFSN